MAREKPPIVLVHGGMHGGWCWKRMRPLLAAAGHDVFTPTLTGLGERAHLGGREVGLSTHVEDVLAMVRAEELERFVLVGHSYGGMVITGVAEAIGEKLVAVVYLDALAPRDGECAADISGLRIDYAALPDGMIPVFPDYTFGLADPADIAWVMAHVTPQSARTVLEPLRIVTDHARLPRWFIECTAGRGDTTVMDGIAARAAEVARDPSWRHVTFEAPHDCMVSHPRETADLILDIVRAADAA
ncbi:MAG: alpha/beta fold hydrolase [Novosphingobium sp.]|nr:alpha/beta fold hydrolase [Novosphingobium sp.]